MNITDNTAALGAGERFVAGGSATIKTRLRQFAQAWTARRRRRREMDELALLSDHDLWDLGLGRSDVTSIMDGTYSRD
jgi:uncharacterized protein YjiS (DUF1127 family)